MEENTMKLDIVSRVDRMHIAQMIRKGLVGRHLVEVPQQGISADGERSEVALHEVKPLARHVPRRSRFLVSPRKGRGAEQGRKKPDESEIGSIHARRAGGAPS